MDPNFFHVDLERSFQAIIAIVLLSMFLERTLALVFEHRWYVEHLDTRGFKTPIAFGAALFLCRRWEFDAVSVIVLQESTSWPGYVITAGVIAGGSKASIKFFHDFLGVRGTAVAARGEAAPQPEPTTESKTASRGSSRRKANDS